MKNFDSDTRRLFTLKKQMQAALQKVAAAKGLSKDVQEVVVRALGREWVSSNCFIELACLDSQNSLTPVHFNLKNILPPDERNK